MFTPCNLYNISKFSRISRKWSESPLFSRVWGFSKIGKAIAPHVFSVAGQASGRLRLRHQKHLGWLLCYNQSAHARKELCDCGGPGPRKQGREDETQNQGDRGSHRPEGSGFQGHQVVADVSGRRRSGSQVWEFRLLPSFPSFPKENRS